MDRISASAVAGMLLTAPAWARIGLTVRDERLRGRAADCIAATIVGQLDPPERTDDRQIPLAL